MSIHVNIGEAKTRLSELVTLALAGEEVVLQKAGVPKLVLMRVEDVERIKREDVARRRIANIGKYRDAYAGVDLTVLPSMTDEELDARERRICGPAD
jgi:antitoxin (DNA-binding transcriptional repressor) of toxin-antitoxin stability system